MANARSDSERIASRLARGLAGLLALAALLTLGCEGGEDSAPPSPTTTATATAAATPIATATPPAAPRETVTPTVTATRTAMATPPETPSPTPTPTATPRATATPTATATPVATAAPAPTPMATPTATATPTPTPEPPPPVTVSGPLLVFSERVGIERDAPERKVEVRQVVIYEVGAERYWTPFEYRDAREQAYNPRRLVRLSGVEPAGTSLIVWSEREIRRVGLNGETEAVLFGGEIGAVREIKVSPDATKVAAIIGHGLRVLDAATSESLLHIAVGDPLLGPLQGSRLALGGWRADGGALSITSIAEIGSEPRTAIVALDGAVRVLPEGLAAAPDLRYALRIGDELPWGGTAFTGHAPVWDRLEVLDIETLRTVWTISHEDGVQSSWVAPSWWLGGSRYVAFGVTYVDEPRLLDTATGETILLTPEIERLIEGSVTDTCGASYSYGPRHSPCDVRYDGRIVWEGTHGWTHYLGLIDLPGDLTLRGVAPLEVPDEPLPPPPPPREEMEGPLLLYEVHTTHDTLPVLAIAYDEGTGRSWRLHRRPRDYYCSQPQTAVDGFVACAGSEVLYVAVDGQTETLVPTRCTRHSESHPMERRWWSNSDLRRYSS